MSNVTNKILVKNEQDDSFSDLYFGVDAQNVQLSDGTSLQEFMEKGTVLRTKDLVKTIPTSHPSNYIQKPISAKAVMDLQKYIYTDTHFKGDLATYEELNEIAEPAEGDTYYIHKKGCSYTYVGNKWHQSTAIYGNFEKQALGYIVVSDEMPVSDDTFAATAWVKSTPTDNSITVPTIEDFNELVIASANEPSNPMNRIWIDTSIEEDIVEIPTWSDFISLKDSIPTLSEYIKMKDSLPTLESFKALQERVTELEALVKSLHPNHDMEVPNT